MSENLKPENHLELEQAAEKLRACRSLALKINNYGLDINLNEQSFLNLNAFKEVWQTITNKRDRAILLQMSGLTDEDIVALVEFLKYLKAWEVSQSYGN